MIASCIFLEASDVHRSFTKRTSPIVDEMKMRKKRSVQPRKTIEVMIAADYKMVEHYSKLFLPTYMLSVSNIVCVISIDLLISPLYLQGLAIWFS